MIVKGDSKRYDNFIFSTPHEAARGNRESEKENLLCFSVSYTIHTAQALKLDHVGLTCHKIW